MSVCDGDGAPTCKAGKDKSQESGSSSGKSKGFFNVPRELRNSVYSLVLSEPTDVVAMAYNTPGPPATLWQTATYLVVPITLVHPDAQNFAITSKQSTQEIDDARDDAVKTAGVTVDLSIRGNSWYFIPTRPSSRTTVLSLDESVVNGMKDVRITSEFTFAVYFTPNVPRESHKEALTVFLHRSSGIWAITNHTFSNNVSAAAVWAAHSEARTLVQQGRSEILNLVLARFNTTLQGAGPMTARLLHELQANFGHIRMVRHSAPSSGHIFRLQVS